MTREELDKELHAIALARVAGTEPLEINELATALSHRCVFGVPWIKANTKKRAQEIHERRRREAAE